MKTLVIYKCWGCGSIKEVYENIDETIPRIEQWNLCPDCVKKGRKEER